MSFYPDSWFEPAEYVSSLDPNYVSFEERVSDVMYILAIVALIMIAIAIPIFTVIGFVVVVKKIIARFRKK